jgi:hypothetical protein
MTRTRRVDTGSVFIPRRHANWIQVPVIFGQLGFESPLRTRCDKSGHGLHLSRVIGYGLPRLCRGSSLVGPVVSVTVEAGSPWVLIVSRKLFTTSPPPTRR